MPYSEFTEALFEQCVSHELNTRFHAFIVGGIPTKPSQLEEKLAGYDSAYKLVSGREVFLQFKVARYVAAPIGAGAATFYLWGTPYLRAPLHYHDDEGYAQHNALVGLSEPPNLACYCAPCFYERDHLSSLYSQGLRGATGVLGETLFAPLIGVPRISPSDRRSHSITYPEDGSAFRLHTEPSEPFAALSAAQVFGEADSVEWTPGHFAQLEERVLMTLEESGMRVRSRQPPQDDAPLERIAQVLEEYLSAVLVLIPDEPRRSRG